MPEPNYIDSLVDDIFATGKADDSDDIDSIVADLFKSEPKTNKRGLRFVVGSKTEPGEGQGSTLGALGKTLTRVPENLIASGIKAVQGVEGPSITDQGMGDKFVNLVDSRNKALAKEYEGAGDFIPGLISKQDVSQLGPNLAFSGVSMAGTVAGGAAGVATPIPGGSIVGGMLGGGVAAHRMQSYQAMNDWLNKKNDESIKQFGRPINSEEEKAFKENFSQLATESGLWEAGPEAVGNVLELALMVGKKTVPGAKVIPDSVFRKVAKGVGRAAGIFGTEQLTETITRHGQHNAEVGAGQTTEPERSFTSPEDWLKSSKEVMPQVLLLSGFMGAGGAVYRGIAKKDGPPPPPPPKNPMGPGIQREETTIKPDRQEQVNAMAEAATLVEAKKQTFRDRLNTALTDADPMAKLKAENEAAKAKEIADYQASQALGRESGLTSIAPDTSYGAPVEATPGQESQPPQDLIGQGQINRQRQIDKAYEAEAEKEANIKRFQDQLDEVSREKEEVVISDDAKTTLDLMSESIQDTRGNERGTTTAGDESEGDTSHNIGSSHPEWFQNLSGLIEFETIGKKKDGSTGTIKHRGISKDTFNAIVNKIKTKGYDSLTDIQKRYWFFIEHAIPEFKAQSPDIKAMDDLAFMEKEGYEPMGGEEVVAGDLNEGDKVLIRGEEFENKGMNPDGTMTLEDGIPVTVDVFDKIRIDGIKKAPKQEAPEELRKQIEEAAIKAGGRLDPGYSHDRGTFSVSDLRIPGKEQSWEVKTPEDVVSKFAARKMPEVKPKAKEPEMKPEDPKAETAREREARVFKETQDKFAEEAVSAESITEREIRRKEQAKPEATPPVAPASDNAAETGTGKAEESPVLLKPGKAWIDDQQRPVLGIIKPKGKRNKGKIIVILNKAGKRAKIDETAMIEWPEFEALGREPIEEEQTVPRETKTETLPDGSTVDWNKVEKTEKDGLKATYYATYNKDGSFKKWSTRTDINRLKALKGTDGINLKQDNYGKQDGITKKETKGKQEGLGLVVEDPNQPSMFKKAGKAVKSEIEKSTEKIEDFGEKIGGARKDTAESGYALTGKVKKEEGPAWRKKYVAMEKVDGTGWTIGKAGDRFGISARSSQKFATQEEAEAAIPLIAVADSHRVYRKQKDGGYSIFKKVGEKKLFKVVNQDFPSREEAMKYMAEHAEDILNIKTTFGEEILPVPDNAQRKGVERRATDATPEMFVETFAPRGIEFGNWNNQEERQQVMNHAYDGLLDLAEVLNLPPKALMLNGELAIAFGARGQGLSGAKAHYEPDYSVINLTKMKGAGSLAHEVFHAIDNYLARLDTKASSEKKANKQGDMVYDRASNRVDFQSHGASYKSQLRQELRDSFKTLMEGMYRKAEQYVEDTKQADEFIKTARENLKRILDGIRTDLTRDLTNYHKSKGGYSGKAIKFFEPASAEQLAEFDRLSNILLEGGDLKTSFRYNQERNPGEEVSFKGLNRMQQGKALAGRHSNDTLESLNAILKAVRDKSGFRKEGGSLAGVRAAMNTYSERLRMFEDAQAGTEKTKKVPTTYAIEAKKMDQARTSDYWSEPHEMAARAFAAYVEDKIAEKGGQSDFLVYRAHGGILLPMIDGFVARPYPEGEERIAINKLFDTFVGEIKTKETDKGVAMYSVDPETKGQALTLANVQNIFKGQDVKQDGDNFTVTLKNGITIPIQGVESITPNEIALKLGHGEAQFKAGQAITGAYDGKSIRIVRDSEKAPWTLTHEAVHFLEDTGIINKEDQFLVTIQAKKEGAWNNKLSAAENRANWLADFVTGNRPERTSLQKLWDKIKGFINGIAGIRTAEQIGRELKSGRIFEGKGQKALSEGMPQFSLKEARYFVKEDRYAEKRGEDGPFHDAWRIYDRENGTRLPKIYSNKNAAESAVKRLNDPDIRYAVTATEEEIRIANETSRARGAVGQNAVVPKVVRENIKEGDTILDFGSGKDAVHAQALRDEGYDATAYDFGENVVAGRHDTNALDRQYDVVYASNVLNVQSSENMLKSTLGDIAKAVKKDGIAIVNYPKTPRKMSNFTTGEMRAALAELFGKVESVPNREGVFKLSKPRDIQYAVAETPVTEDDIRVAAEKYNGTYDGEWKDFGAWSVTDNVTKTSFMVRTPKAIAKKFAEDRGESVEQYSVFQARKDLATDTLSTIEKFTAYFDKAKPVLGTKKDLSYGKDLIASIPAFYKDKGIPAVKSIYDATQERMDEKAELEYGMENVETKNGVVNTIKALSDLQKEGEKAYKPVKDYIVYTDRQDFGFKLRKDDGEWVVKDRSGQKILFRVGKGNKTEPIGIEKLLEFEANDLKERGFTPEQINAIIAVRLTENKGFELLFASMRKLIEDAKAGGFKLPEIPVYRDGKHVTISLKQAMAEMGDMRGSYFPRIRRQGRFIMTAKKEGEYSVLEPFNSQILQKPRIKELESQGFEVTVGRNNQVGEDVFQLAGNLVKTQQIVNAALDRVSRDREKGITEGMVEETEREIREMFASSVAEQISNIIKERGARVHMTKRSDNVYLGYEEDPLIAIPKYIKGLSGAEAKKNMTMKMLRALTGTEKSWAEYKEENEDAEYKDYIKHVKTMMIEQGKQPYAFKWAIAYIGENTRNPDFADNVVNWLRGAAVGKYLAFRVFSAPLVNLTALPTSVIATLKGAGLSYGRAWQELGRGIQLYGNYLWSRDKMSADDRWIFDYMSKKGWDDAQYSSESLSALRSTLGKGWDKAIELGMFTFSQSEKLNRAATISAAFNGLSKLPENKGKSKEEIADMAKQVSDDSHGVYNKGNYPYIALGGNPAAHIARMMYVFQRFSHTYLMNMKKLGFEQKDYVALAHMVVAPAIIAGAGASVLTPIISALLKAFGFDDPEEEVYKAMGESFGPTGETVSRYGMAGLAGISIKGSLSIGVGAIPTSIKDILGAPGSVVSDIFIDGIPMIADGNVSKGFEKIMPTGIGNLARAYRESTEGVTTKTNRPVFYGKEQLKTDSFETFLRALSFYPERVATIREKQYKEFKTEEKYTEKRTDIYASIKKFYLTEDRDKEKWLDILAEIQAYNEKAQEAGPHMPLITNKSIKTNLKRSFKPSKKERAR